MNIEKYTDRARGFVQSAQSLAPPEGQHQISPAQMVKVLLDDEMIEGTLINQKAMIVLGQAGIPVKVLEKTSKEKLAAEA